MSENYGGYMEVVGKGEFEYKLDSVSMVDPIRHGKMGIHDVVFRKHSYGPFWALYVKSDNAENGHMGEMIALSDSPKGCITKGYRLLVEGRL